MRDISKEERIGRLITYLPHLSEGQVVWVERIVHQFRRARTFVRDPKSDIISEAVLQDFGDALRVHHCFTDEPFTKDKFEYTLVRVCDYFGLPAMKAAKTAPGAYVTIAGERFSLKTQGDKKLRLDQIHISKYMELGKGEWTDQPDQLPIIAKQFFAHLSIYERILTLRAIERPDIARPYWGYELVEIPKALLLEAQHGEYKMILTSSQKGAKPGRCRVYDSAKKKKFELYFDGGTERKLQIQKLDKNLCSVHATWEFIVQELDEE